MCATLEGLTKQASAIARHQLRNDQIPRFRTVLSDLLDQEARSARGAIRSSFGTRDESDFLGWMERFYPEHAERMTEALRPVVSEYGERVVAMALEEIGEDAPISVATFTNAFTEGLSARWTGRSIAQFRQILRDEEDVPEVATARLETWEENRAQAVAERESTQANGAFAKHAFLLGGVSALMWRAVGSSCPLCTRMDGRIVEITRSFLSPGDTVESGVEGRGDLRVDKSIGHPPLHGAAGGGGVCDCVVTAA